MNSSEKMGLISEAVASAQSEFKGVGKSGENKFDKYSYAKLEDYVKASMPILSKHGLSVLTSVDEVVALPERKTQKGGTEYGVRVKLTVRLLHKSGQWIEAAAWGEGQDRSDKATYKAITGARKYGLAAVLGLATTDDPEADENVGQAEAPEPGKPTEDESFELSEQIDRVGLSEADQKKWLNRAGVDNWCKLNRDQVLKAIAKLKTMPAAQAAA